MRRQNIFTGSAMKEIGKDIVHKGGTVTLLQKEISEEKKEFDTSVRKRINDQFSKKESLLLGIIPWGQTETILNLMLGGISFKLEDGSKKKTLLHLPRTRQRISFQSLRTIGLQPGREVTGAQAIFGMIFKKTGITFDEIQDDSDTTSGFNGISFVINEQEIEVL